METTTGGKIKGDKLGHEAQRMKASELIMATNILFDHGHTYLM